MDNRTLRLKECRGKTISGTYYSGDCIGLTFSDGTWFFGRTCGCEIDNYAALDQQDKRWMGLLDEAEIRRLEAEEKRRAAEALARKEEHDRRTYEALKARFEPDKATPHSQPAV